MAWIIKIDEFTYVFICNTHKVAVKAYMLISNINSSLVPHLTNDVAKPSKHLVCALLRRCRLLQSVIHS